MTDINKLLRYTTSAEKKNAFDNKKSSLSYNKLFPDSTKLSVTQFGLNKLMELRTLVNQNKIEGEMRNKDIIMHKIEWHRKFSISLACLILFFIGAPLGAIIRKGGMGMPLVMAIIFFLIFHLLNMFGEKFVKEEIVAPAFGMWQAIICLAPIGAFLSYKAMHDSLLFNREYYWRLFKKTKSLFSRTVKTN